MSIKKKSNPNIIHINTRTSGILDKRVPLKPVLGGSGGKEGGGGAYGALQIKMLSYEETPIFVRLCVLCFYGLPYRFYWFKF